MERSRLKNIIILILVLVNCFLLASLGLRRSAADSARRRTVGELTALFAEDGVTLDGSAVSNETPQPGGILARSASTDAAVAAFLLGDGAQMTDEGGGVQTYVSPTGRATFRSGGSFDATGTLGTGSSPEGFCRKFCKAFRYEELTVSFSAGSGSAEAVQYFSGSPVVNASITFQAENGRLVSVSGIHLPDTLTGDGGGTMTAATALTRFLAARQEMGYVVSAVTDVKLCYQLQSTAAAAMVLAPAWRVETDTGNYYVNCSSGAVTRG